MTDIIMPSSTNKSSLTLHIPGHLFDEMHRATNLCKVEMSMLGLLKRVPQGLVLDRLFIPPQIVGDNHAQINPEQTGQLQAKLFQEGVIKPESKDTFLRFAWHSHVDMIAQMSVPDRQTFNALGGNGTVLDPEWFISMVMNRMRQYEVIFDLYQPVRSAINITDDVIIGDPMFARKELVETIRMNVRLGEQTIIGGRPCPGK